MSNKFIATLSRYYDVISLLLFSLSKLLIFDSIVRLIFAGAFYAKPVLATLIFPILTLKLYSLPIKFTSILIQYTLINHFIFGETMLSDLLISAVLIAVTIALIELLLKKKQHIIVDILAANAFLFGLSVIMKDYMYIDFTPLCKSHPTCTSEEIRSNTFLPEVLYTILFIFINGPLKVL